MFGIFMIWLYWARCSHSFLPWIWFRKCLGFLHEYGLLCSVVYWNFWTWCIFEMVCQKCAINFSIFGLATASSTTKNDSSGDCNWCFFASWGIWWTKTIDWTTAYWRIQQAFNCRKTDKCKFAGMWMTATHMVLYWFVQYDNNSVFYFDPFVM